MTRHSHMKIADWWDSGDPRDVPAYSIPEAAHYLSIPRATLRAWVLGMRYRTKEGKVVRFRSVIDLPLRGRPLLSFFNLVEAHVLRGLRTQHAVRLPKIRRALDYVKKEMGWPRPLIQQEFKTDGVSLFVERLGGQIVDVAERGQLVIRDVMAHLERVEWEQKVAARLYPFTRLDAADAPRSVVIDPRFSFGRPMLIESRVTTAVVAERYKAGESIESLAEDYGCTPLEIQEGVRCELKLSAAA
jgi:uncharacterized protein (DUF433 family)